MTAETEPTSIVQGDTLSWLKDLPDYLPASGWALTYYFAHPSLPVFKVTATDNGDGRHLVTVPTATSRLFAQAGRFSWQAVVTKASERYTVATGILTVARESAEGATVDTRSWARRMLDAVEATLENRATHDQLSLSYSTGSGSRSIQHSTFAELEQLRENLRRQLRAEEAAQSAGLGRNIGVRLVRV